MQAQDQVSVEFSSAPPPITQLKYFYQDAGWNASDEFIAQTIPFKPHPILETVWVCLAVGGSPVGMARVYLPPPVASNPPAFIADVVISQSSRGKGLGSLLLGKIEEHCKKRKILLLAIESSAQSNAFWARHGFSLKPPIPQVLFKSIG
jgi:GNAT superfamily N-acetyltransferase